MRTWVIGDIHGCWRVLERLLQRIDWQPRGDRLWLVGDLVNRGPDSLAVLRWAYGNRDRVTTVLGNHDLYLLARAAGVVGSLDDDRLDEVLGAEDCADVLGWLRSCPFLLAEGREVVVHAGLWPGWELGEARDLAAETGAWLAGRRGPELLEALSDGGEHQWRAGLRGMDRVTAAAAVFTLIRVARADGSTKLGFTGPPEDAPEGFRPWYLLSPVPRQGRRVLFGHWARLGLRSENGFVCLDSGCVWGGRLSALCLADGRLIQDCHQGE